MCSSRSYRGLQGKKKCVSSRSKISIQQMCFDHIDKHTQEVGEDSPPALAQLQGVGGQDNFELKRRMQMLVSNFFFFFGGGTKLCPGANLKKNWGNVPGERESGGKKQQTHMCMYARAIRSSTYRGVKSIASYDDECMKTTSSIHPYDIMT